MSQSSIPQESRLNIHPGEWYFGTEFNSLYTLLGSCVAITVWHPKLKVGGICHYLLPTATEQTLKKERQANLSGRYAAMVLPLMKQKMLSLARPNDFQVGLFGGSDSKNSFTIGKQNIVYAQHWLAEQKITPVYCDVGGNLSRTLVFDVLTGEVKVKAYAMT